VNAKEAQLLNEVTAAVQDFLKTNRLNTLEAMKLLAEAMSGEGLKAAAVRGYHNHERYRKLRGYED